MSRSETYRFVNPEVADATVSVSSTSPVELYYSPYTNFPSGWQTMSPDGPTASLDTASSPLPVPGASDGQHVYGVASGSTLGYPAPGYNAPHLVISGSRLAPPQVGTQASPVTFGARGHGTWRTVFFRAADSSYGFELGGELAMAEALGFSLQDSPAPGAVPRSADATGSNLPASELPRLASAGLGLVSRATSYWLELQNTLGDVSVTPSMHYAPGTWMRDSFSPTWR